MFALFVCFGGTIGLLDSLDYGKHVITIDYGKQKDEGNKNGYRKQVDAEKLLNCVRNNILDYEKLLSEQVDYRKHSLCVNR